MEEEEAEPEAEETAEEADKMDPTEKASNARDTDPNASQFKRKVRATILPTLASEHHIEQIW